jgi:glycerophosphoryl diester phosphodiesterase
MTCIPKCLSVALITTLLTACMPPQKNPRPDVHGHRGCRGLLPENSLPAFEKAVELGCDFVELDVVMSADGQVIVSHEPWMRGLICTTPEGERIPEEQSRMHNIHRMTVTEIQAYDCGSTPHPDFPEQKHLETFKPTLMEVVEATDEFALLSGSVSPNYNIEIKSDPAWYGIYQPDPTTYARAVIATIDSLGISDRCIVQSFDPAVLEAVHADRPDLATALLVENNDGLEKNLARLSFVPRAYSPHFSQADEGLLKSLRDKDIELVVWTVNAPADIDRMLALGVDGVISDYPDRVMRALESVR